MQYLDTNLRYPSHYIKQSIPLTTLASMLLRYLHQYYTPTTTLEIPLKALEAHFSTFNDWKKERKSFHIHHTHTHKRVVGRWLTRSECSGGLPGWSQRSCRCRNTGPLWIKQLPACPVPSGRPRPSEWLQARGTESDQDQIRSDGTSFQDVWWQKVTICVGSGVAARNVMLC